MSFSRGDVVLARLNPNQGAEMGKVRPVLVLTETMLIQAGLPMVMVVPLSSQLWGELSPFRVEITARERLLKTSYLVLEQARSIDRSRIKADLLTRLTTEELQKTETQFKLMLGLN